MNTTNQVIAKHFREVYGGGNWTGVNLKEALTDISWQEAVTKVHLFNSVALLVFHINYYVNAVINVLHSNALIAHDKYSFDLLTIASEQDWKNLLKKF